MKKARFSLFLVMIMLLTAVTPAFAQAGLPGICSGVMLQNTSTTATTSVNMDFYSGNEGTIKYSYADPDLIPASGAHAYYIPTVLSVSALPDGIYSVVVTSQQLLNSLVNERTCSDTDFYVQSSGSGINAANTATTVYLGYVQSRAFSQKYSSAIAIQNAGTADTTTLKIEFFSSNAATPGLKETFTSTPLKPGETWYLDLSQGTYASANLDGFYGAAKITSDQPVAAFSNYAPLDGSSLLTYNGLSEAAALSTKMYAPQVTKKMYADVFTTGFNIYNPNATDTPMRVTYYALGSTTEAFHEDFTVLANSAWIKYLGNEVGLPATFAGSAVFEVTSGTNKVLGIVNNRSEASASKTMSAAWSLVRDEDSASTLFLPSITRNYGTQMFESGYQIYNVTGSPVDVDVTFTSRTAGGPTMTQHIIGIPANAPSAAYYLKNPIFGALGDNWIGAAVITVITPGGKVVSQGNQVAENKLGDSESIYNAFGQ